MRWWASLLVLLAVTGLAFGGYVLREIHHIEIEQISEDLHVLYGVGGNVAVLATEEGTVIVDTMTLQYQGGRIREIAESLTGQPVVMIINSHYHLDHTHGNPAFEPGTRVVATERTLHHLKMTDSDYFDGAAASLLPNETFVDALSLDFGDKHLQLTWPGRGHTDGDLVVLFEEEGVIHTGDLFFNHHYPNIDLESGGSVREWAGTIDRIFELPFTGVIPGHGPYTTPEELRAFQRFVDQLASLAEAAVATGMPLEQFLSTAKLTADEGYTEIKLIVGIGLTRDFVLTRAYEEASGTVSVRP